MKKVIFLILFIHTFVAISFAEQDSQSQKKHSMTLYRENYFTAGDNIDQIKFQFSAKYQLYISKDDPTDNQKNKMAKLIGNSAFFAYTQTSWWLVYGDRDTFSTNYQPEFFFKVDSKDNLMGWDFGPVKYLKLSPIYHCSTGVEGPDHRSINEFYAEFDVSYVDLSKQNEIGINPRVFGYWSKDLDHNKDINDFRRNYDAKIYYKHTFDWKDKDKHFYNLWQVVKEQGFNFKCTGNPFGKGYYMIESTSKLFRDYFQSKLFIQYSHGYGVNFVEYNIKKTEFRGGVLFDF